MKSRHEAQRLRLQRRTFLKAIGLGLSAPLAFKMSKLAIAAPEGPQTRLLIYFLPHGAPFEHFEPTDAMDFTASGIGILDAFTPFKAQTTVLRGVSMNNGANNHAAISAALTGFIDGAGSDSIDYLIAQQLGTTAHVLGVQPYRSGGAPDHDSHFAKHGSWVTPIANPADAVEDLFTGLGQVGAPPAVDESAFRNEALTLTEGEVAAMQQELSGLTTEENKLGEHLKSLAALKASNSGGGVISCTERPALPSVDAMVGKDPFAMANFATVLDGHLELAANAFACGTARIITLQNMYCNAQLMMDFPGGPGVAKNHHDPLSHTDYSQTSSREEFAKVQKWFYQRLADKFLSVLSTTADPTDPSHTVLDNTVVLICTEIADGQMHNSQYDPKGTWYGGQTHDNYMPWLLIGGGGGFLKGGQRAFTQVMHTDILATVAACMGVNLQTIGGQTVSVPEVLKA